MAASQIGSRGDDRDGEVFRTGAKGVLPRLVDSGLLDREAREGYDGGLQGKP